jgi:hypothetical protein
VDSREASIHAGWRGETGGFVRLSIGLEDILRERKTERKTERKEWRGYEMSFTFLNVF